MNELEKKPEISELKVPEPQGFKEIKPEGGSTLQQAAEFVEGLFDGLSKENHEPEVSLEKLVKDYFDDIKSKSEFPETIPNAPFEISELEKISPEKNAEMREEFSKMKEDLKKQWEGENGVPWPKYEEDVVSENGSVIRKAGMDYDIHHIQPLGLGGKNEVSNITPLHAGVHYDRQGVHSPDSPYSKIDNLLGGKAQ